MWYRLSYSHNNLTDELELSTSQDMVEIEAWDLLDKHNQIGTVVIERRPSEYYGEYRHFLTISQGLDSGYRPNNDKVKLGPVPSSIYGRRPIRELCIFKQLKLDDEPRDLRKLLWICECKTLALKDSETLKMLKDMQEKQIDTIKKSGISYDNIVEFAEFYEFADALLMH